MYVATNSIVQLAGDRSVRGWRLVSQVTNHDHGFPNTSLQIALLNVNQMYLQHGQRRSVQYTQSINTNMQCNEMQCDAPC